MAALPFASIYSHRMSRFRDILMATIGSSIVLPTISGIINNCGTNNTLTEVIGSSEIGDTPFQNQSNFVE